MTHRVAYVANVQLRWLATLSRRWRTAVATSTSVSGRRWGSAVAAVSFAVVATSGAPLRRPPTIAHLRFGSRRTQRDAEQTLSLSHSPWRAHAVPRSPPAELAISAALNSEPSSRRAAQKSSRPGDHLHLPLCMRGNCHAVAAKSADGPVAPWRDQHSQHIASRSQLAL
jgi:hypothetical protein